MLRAEVVHAHLVRGFGGDGHEPEDRVGQARQARHMQVVRRLEEIAEVVSTYDAEVGDRHRYGSVVAQWHDLNNAVVFNERVGDKEPVMTLAKTYASKDEAAKAAASAMSTLRESGSELKLEMPLNVDIFADGPVELADFRDELNGRWTPRRVEHRLDRSGAVTSVTARQLA